MIGDLRKLFDPRLLAGALADDIVAGLRELADSIERGDMILIQAEATACPLKRSELESYIQKLQLARVVIDLAAVSRWAVKSIAEESGE